MLKTELRKIYLSKQKSLSEAERLEKSQQIAQLFFESFSLKTTKYLHVFLPIAKNCEVETKFIYETIWSKFPEIKTIVPRIKADEIESVKFSIKSKIRQNKWQIIEPLESEIVNETLIDIVIVPLLAIDKKGYRVGYGKGFYDKFLAKCRPDCVKVGVSFFEPIEKITDINKFDVKLDYCLTPNNSIKN